MQQAGRLQAVIEILEDLFTHHTPVNLALRDWGKAHRFAGAKDRNAIGNYVHDILRHKSSLAFMMDDDSPRSLTLGAECRLYQTPPKQLDELFKISKFAPPPLSIRELQLCEGGINLTTAPEWIQANIPEWLWPAFVNNFGESALAEGQALSQRPPLDLRVNSLKANHHQITKALAAFAVNPCPISPLGLRILAPSRHARLPNIQTEAVFLTGQVDIQDEGSQIVSLLVAAKPGERILDYCAGSGGKSLALAADMSNQGQIFAFDADKRRLAPLFQRAARAGTQIIDIRQPPQRQLKDLLGQMDKVVIDAPCSGVGIWRRRPDTRWRLNEDRLARHLKTQSNILEQAKAYLRPSGLLFYLTCSMLAEENEAQIYDFLEKNPDFTLLSAGEVWEERFGLQTAKPWSEDGCTLTLTPATTQTDGFFFAVLEHTP